jgi:hypothetical protein
MITPLSPANRDDLVRWPPMDYIFVNPSRKEDFCEEGYKPNGDKFRLWYPELSEWDSRSLVSEWHAYGECTGYAATDVPIERDKYFLCFLYLRQEISIDHGGLDEFDEEWKALGK